MKPNKYLWIGISIFFAWASGSLLADSIRQPGPYAEENVLLGGILGGLGLVAILFSFKQRTRMREFAEHMGRPTGRAGRSHVLGRAHLT
jgi:hypothetical protein